MLAVRYSCLPSGAALAGLQLKACPPSLSFSPGCAPQEARGCNYIWEQVLHVQESSSPRAVGNGGHADAPYGPRRLGGPGGHLDDFDTAGPVGPGGRFDGGSTGGWRALERGQARAAGVTVAARGWGPCWFCAVHALAHLSSMRVAAPSRCVAAVPAHPAACHCAALQSGRGRWQHTCCHCCLSMPDPPLAMSNMHQQPGPVDHPLWLPLRLPAEMGPMGPDPSSSGAVDLPEPDMSNLKDIARVCSVGWPRGEGFWVSN